MYRFSIARRDSSMRINNGMLTSRNDSRCATVFSRESNPDGR